MRKIIFTFLFSLCCFAFFSCTPKPIFVAPSDPYDLANEDYIRASPIIEETIKKSIYTETWYEASQEDKERERDAGERLVKLAKALHVPSVFDLARLVLSYPVSFYLSGGFSGKFAKNYMQIIKEKGMTKEEFLKDMDSRYSKGILEVFYCARAGYPPAVELLKAFKIEPPKKDLLTQKEYQSMEQYKRDLALYENERKAVAGLISSTLVGATKALTNQQQNNQMNSNTFNNTDEKKALTEGGCFSDVECGIGKKCLKANFQIQGMCAEMVDEYGVPSLDTGKEVKPNCSFDTDCPIGFYCYLPDGAINGFCMQR